MNSPFKLFLLTLLSFASANLLDAQWVQVATPGGGNINVLAASPGGAGSSLYAGTDGGVFLSTDRGTSWTPCNTGLSGKVRCFAFSSSVLFAGTQSGSVYRSENGGTTWTATASLPGATWVYDLVVSSTNLFAVTEGGGVFRSTDNGTSWIAANSGLAGHRVSDLASIGTNLFAAGGSGVFRSTDAGASWSSVNNGLPDTSAGPLGVLGTNLFASIWHGIYRSTDFGASWNPNNSLRDGFDYPVNGYAVSGNDIFVACYIIGVFLSRDNGMNWNAVNTGLSMPYTMTLAATNTDLYTSIMLGGVWRRPLSEMLTGVDEPRADMPVKFSLEQNYPNPFNPTTVIKYTVGGAGNQGPGAGEAGAGGLGLGTRVKLAVYDLLGRQVAVLVDERQAAGEHQVTFDATGLSTGVYFYRLTAGDFTETRRMILMR